MQFADKTTIYIPSHFIEMHNDIEGLIKTTAHTLDGDTTTREGVEEQTE